MDDYVADTHAMLWHLFAPQRLGQGAQAAFHVIEAGKARVYIPAVVVAEMIVLVERGRLPTVTVPQLLAELDAMNGSLNYARLPLLPETVIASHA